MITLDIQLRLDDTLRDFARTLEIANEEVSEVVELGGHIGVLGQSRMYHRVLLMLNKKESRKVIDSTIESSPWRPSPVDSMVALRKSNKLWNVRGLASSCGCDVDAHKLSKLRVLSKDGKEFV